MDNDLMKAFVLLGLGSDVTVEELKKRYRSLSRNIHPDLYQEGSRDHQKAHESQKELNNARDAILQWIKRRDQEEKRVAIKAKEESQPEVECNNQKEKPVEDDFNIFKWLAHADRGNLGCAGILLILFTPAMVFAYLAKWTAPNASDGAILIAMFFCMCFTWYLIYKEVTSE